MSQGQIREKRALEHLMDLLAIEGLSGREGKVAEAVREKLRDAGCEEAWMRHDRANRKIPGDYEVGNLIVKIPGTRRAPRRLFSGHLDTVPLCRGAVPVKKGNKIVPKGKTALGGDNRTAVAALVNLVEELLRHDLPRPPLTLFFTVGEEVGLWGARTVSVGDLGKPTMGFNIDGGPPARLVVGAIGADRWQAHVHGRSSHAGLSPEEGVSATLIASRAIAEVAEGGWFGLVEKGRKRGTSNVGTIRGGEATNQVTDYVWLKGECRSHDEKFLKQITGAYRKAFEQAARSVKSSKGVKGKVEFQAERDYDSFRMSDDAPPVVLARQTAEALGLEPKLEVANGGLDANYLTAKGIPTVTLGAGQHNPHTVDEYVDLQEFWDGCRLALALATAE